MENRNELILNNKAKDVDIWEGIGGHFDSLGQVLCEFIDNSISNFIGNNTITSNIIIGLKEIDSKNVKISIEDSGTGIKNLDNAFSLGARSCPESPFNEHGFGLKHALATADPTNSNWSICSRTQDQFDNNKYIRVKAPYTMENLKAYECEDKWPGILNGSGTIVEFVCTKDFYLTLTSGIRGGLKDFFTVADVLCEDIGFIYSGVIKENRASIVLDITDMSNKHEQHTVAAINPDWEDFFAPGEGSEKVNLGNGDVVVEYKFGRMNEKPAREPFNNSTARKYYKKSLSSSGVEIRVNGRVLCYNLFKEIWRLEKHNAYNYLLIILDIKTNDISYIPKTRTSKNGFRNGDEKLEALFNWIRSNLSVPSKETSLSDRETDLFEILASYKEKYSGDKNKIIDTEKYVFASTGNKKDKVRVDLYVKENNLVTVYEGKKDETTSKDVYQLRMYWDGLVFDRVTPNEAVLLADNHPQSVKDLVDIVNTMKDADDNNYNIILKTWLDYGIDVKK